MPLTMVKSGTYVKIQEINAHNLLRSKLVSMGVFNGAKIKVIYSDHQSPILIEVFRTQIAISQKVADTILVETLKPGHSLGF